MPRLGNYFFYSGTIDYLLEFHVMQINDYAVKWNMKRSCKILESSD